MRLGFKELVLLSLPMLFSAIITAPIVNAAPGPDPVASLRVSLPAGFQVGIDPDPWQTESWVLMLLGNTWSFTVRVEEIHSQYASYDTHLVVALTHAGLSKLVSVTIDSVTKYPADFTDDTPSYVWPLFTYTVPPHGIYPTPNNDEYIIGYIDNGYVDISVTATFTDTIGVMMHFDAYGTVQVPPDNEGQITHNPESWDATVKPPPPGVPEFSLATPIATSLGTILLFVAPKVLKRKRD